MTRSSSFKRPETREPKFGFNRTLRNPHGFVGCVVSIYANLSEAINSRAVCSSWFDMQERPPSSKDQIFYGCRGLDGRGGFLVGELDAREA